MVRELVTTSYNYGPMLQLVLTNSLTLGLLESEL